MSVAFAQVQLRDLDEQIETCTTRLADGQPSDWPAYQRMVGERRGLLRARELVTKRFSDEERDTFKLG